MFNWGKFSNWGSIHAFTAAVIDSNTMRFKSFIISSQRGQFLEGIEGQPNEKHWLKLPAAARIEWIWSLIHDKVLARAPNQTTLLFYTIDPKTPLKPGAPGILPTFIQHRRSFGCTHSLNLNITLEGFKALTEFAQERHLIAANTYFKESPAASEFLFCTHRVGFYSRISSNTA